MEAVVIKSTGSWYWVRDQNGAVHNCRLKGKFKIQDLKVTNPIAVGDRVVVELDQQQEASVITKILPRKNYLIRTSVKHPDIGHILASNIDQALLMATLKHPRTSLGFIDRFLVSAESFRIPVLLVFNKVDLLKSKQLAYLNELVDVYNSIGYTCLAISVTESLGLKELHQSLRNKVTLLAGHSGVGKSTLLNHLIPNLDQKTAEVSTSIAKGKHTTTFAEMFEMEANSFIIDTPGIKELGLMEIGEEELSHYFPEMRAFLGACKFNNCTHTHEPNCAITAALNDQIPLSRYESYLSMLVNHDNRR